MCVVVSLHLRLDPPEERLVRGLPFALDRLCVRWSSSNANVALFLAVCDQRRLSKSIDSLSISSLCLEVHALVARTYSARRSYIHASVHAVGSVPPVAEIVGLVSARLEGALVESKVVVRFPSVGSLRLRNPTPDFVRVSEASECLVVRRSVVLIDLAALFVLSQTEVVPFQLCCKTQIFVLLELRSHSVALHDELVLGFRHRVILLCVSSNLHICTLQLRTNLVAVCSLASLPGLLVDLRFVHRLGLFHPFVFSDTSKCELSFRHSGFELLSVLVLIARNGVGAKCRLVG